MEGSTAIATALLPVLGYEAACRLVEQAKQTGRTIRQVALAEGHLTAEQIDALVSPEAICRLGTP